jgi:hypothetical protein
MLVLLYEADCPIARPARLWDRLMVRVRASRLDRELAAGASPDATVPLALRAQILVRARTRRGMARGAQRVLERAMRAPAADRPPSSAAGRLMTPAGGLVQVPVCRDRVRDAAEDLGDLIRRLLGGGAVGARGVALAGVLLSDGSGPLYHRSSAGDLRARVREAVDALDPSAR